MKPTTQILPPKECAAYISKVVSACESHRIEARMRINHLYLALRPNVAVYSSTQPLTELKKIDHHLEHSDVSHVIVKIVHLHHSVSKKEKRIYFFKKIP